MEKNIDAAVGMTRKWDAREAGREVARDTIQQLKGPPNFFILFSTIHYRDHGGFEELLKGIWDVLPKGTPLVGGTVPGFVNNYGCYTRGATSLAVSCSNMDVSIGIGKNMKRSPKKAAKQCAMMIEEGFAKSKYNHRFLFNFASGPETMKIPGQDYKKIINSGFISKFVTVAFGISQYLFQKGPGREDELFEELVKKFPEYTMILGASMDDHKGIDNYQFFNDEVLTNSVVSLGLSTDLNFDVCTTHGMNKTDLKFNITKLSRDGHIIRKINGRSAVPELLRLLDWPEDLLNEKTMYNIIPYYPISLRRHGREVPAIMPGFLKDSIITPCVIEEGEVSILTVSGNNLITAIQENLRLFDNSEFEFGLFSACVTILQTLGYKTNIIKNEITHYFKEKPFIMFFSAGEGTYSQTKKLTYANISFNSAVFGYNKHNS